MSSQVLVDGPRWIPEVPDVPLGLSSSVWFIVLNYPPRVFFSDENKRRAHALHTRLGSLRAHRSK